MVIGRPFCLAAATKPVQPVECMLCRRTFYSLTVVKRPILTISAMSAFTDRCLIADSQDSTQFQTYVLGKGNVKSGEVANCHFDSSRVARSHLNSAGCPVGRPNSSPTPGIKRRWSAMEQVKITANLLTRSVGAIDNDDRSCTKALFAGLAAQHPGHELG